MTGRFCVSTAAVVTAIRTCDQGTQHSTHTLGPCQGLGLDVELPLCKTTGRSWVGVPGFSLYDLLEFL